ncbi:MAG: hypothetical protein KJO76_09230 [Gammaproteobacteria bacterium]|nr:hypothetical protein [Gammaproteobacteria bacterium]
MPVTVMIALVPLLGCSPGEEPPAKSDAEKQQALEESAFGDMTSTLDRAKEVEDLNADRKRQLDEAMEK